MKINNYCYYISGGNFGNSIPTVSPEDGTIQFLKRCVLFTTPDYEEVHISNNVPSSKLFRIDVKYKSSENLW